MGYLCFKNSALLFERNKKGFYICTRLRDASASLRRASPLKGQTQKTLEKWQSR